MRTLRQLLAHSMMRLAQRLMVHDGPVRESSHLAGSAGDGPLNNSGVSRDVELAAGIRVLKVLARQLTRTADDLQMSVLKVSTGFSGMAQQAREAVQLSQCRVQSQEGMNRVLESANQTLLQVDTIAKEARIVGLNGQIEAARAGEQGVAFSVVANETKSLAFHAATTSGSLKKMLSELSHLHQGLVNALQSSECASHSLTGEISKAVMGLQFQDRVNQQIEHIVETLDALHDRISPGTSHISPPLVEARLNEWCNWMDSRSTMESERSSVYSSSAGSHSDGADSGFGSVELF